MFEIEIRTSLPEAAFGAKALETMEFRFAFRVYLTAIECLALILLAKDLVGRVDLGKALGRLRVVLVGVWVQLFGELAKRALDRCRICILFHPQYFIGVAHCEFLRFGAGIRHRL